jgi:hypothetical protein
MLPISGRIPRGLIERREMAMRKGRKDVSKRLRIVGVKIVFSILFAVLFTACGGGGDGSGGDGGGGELAQAFSQVCYARGTIVENAADFTGEAGIHPIVLLELGGGIHEWTDNIPSEWQPLSVSATELVACVGGPHQIFLERCEYIDGPTITRYGSSVSIDLVLPKTAETVKLLTIRNSPRECRSEEPLELTELEASPVSFDQVESELSEFFNQPYTGRPYIAFELPDTRRIPGRSPIVGDPRDLAFDGTYLWLADSSRDMIHQLMIYSNRSDVDVVSSFNSPGNNPVGLAFDGTYLWLADDAEVYQLDTAGNVIASFDSPGRDPRGLAFDGTYLWLVDANSNKIYRIRIGWRP